MGHAHDPARAMRERLKILETRERARMERQAVEKGVAETIALDAARGAAFANTSSERSGRGRPYRRQAGLDWLAAKGRITAGQKQAGEAYGALYRRASVTASIGSTLGRQPNGGQPAGPSLALLLKTAAGRMRAEQELLELRRKLFSQSDLVGVCDQICGQELTPREAGGGERQALRIEVVLKVALDILATR